MTGRLAVCITLFAALVHSPLVSAANDRAGIEDQINVAVSHSDFDHALHLANDYLASNADDAGMRFRKAQILGWQGKLDDASQEYTSLQEQFPENVDYVFGHAQILLQQGEIERALGALREAGSLAPRYEDVWRLYFQTLTRQPQQSAAELEKVRAYSATEFPDAPWWHAQPEAGTPSWTLQAGGSVERLSDGLPGWNSQFTQLTYGGVENHRYFVRGARDERFGRSDAQLSLGADWQLPQDWFAGITLASSSSPEFMPRSQFELRAGRPVFDGWVAGVTYRRRNYASDRVDSYSGTIEHYFGDFRAAWTLGLSDLNSGSRSFGQVLAFNWYASDALSIGTSVNFGDEAEAVAPGQVLETRVRGLALTGRYSLNARVGFDWWLGVHEQGDLYRRQYAGMAVSVGI